MTEKRISTDLEPELIEQVDTAAKSLKISRITYIKRAVIAKLHDFKVDKTLLNERDRAYEERDDANAAIKDAHQQRDLFKARMEEAVESLAVADAKLKAYEKRGWLARLIGGKPKPSETGGMTLESLIRFHFRLKNVGMTPKQIDQILHPLYESAGTPIILDGDEVVKQVGKKINKNRSQGRQLK